MAIFGAICGLVTLVALVVGVTDLGIWYLPISMAMGFAAYSIGKHPSAR